jgi:hypothetical protein
MKIEASSYRRRLRTDAAVLLGERRAAQIGASLGERATHLARVAAAELLLADEPACTYEPAAQPETDEH